MSDAVIDSSTPVVRDERTLLHDYLNAQRAHILGALEGLDDEALRRPVLPSGWSCLGLVQHLTLDVERFWFAGVMAGDRAVLDALDAGGNAWVVDPDVPASAVLEGYREEIIRSDLVIAGLDLLAPPGFWPEDLFGNWHPESLGRVILHVMTETAGHTGHLDAVRELIDGTQWLVLEEG
ncbi:MAG: DinB family protein [Thermomicrobiales bacterium]